MPAMSMTEETRHACHISFVSNQVCLPSFLKGTRFACHIFKIQYPFPVKHVRFRSNLIVHPYISYLNANKFIKHKGFLVMNRGRGTGTAVLGRRRTPDGEGRGTEAFLQIRPLQGRRRTKDR